MKITTTHMLQAPAAASLALAMASAAPAADVTWNLNASGNWGDTQNWSPQQLPAAGDDVFFDGPAIGMGGAHRIITLGDDRTVNSITVLGPTTGHVFRIAGANQLTVLSGNLYMDGHADGPNSALEIASALQIGDGVTPVTDAVWTSFNTLNRGLDISGSISAIAGTQIRLTGVADAGNPIVTLRGDNSNFLGTFVVDSPGNFHLRVEGLLNTLGAGTIVANTVTYINDVSGGGVLAASQAANIQANADVYIHAGNSNNPDSTRTFHGDFSGSGDLRINHAPGLSTIWQGTVQMTGNNTHSGNVVIRAGALRMDGVWTGGGNVSFEPASSANRPVRIEGSGVWGLGSGNTITVTGHASTATNTASVAPGTLGTIGTLTLGTDETNTIVFGVNSALNIDIDGADSDSLVINGSLDLSHDDNTLVINALGAPTAGSYTLVTYTGSLSGEFSNVVGLLDGYELDYSTAGQINLIPEPTSVALLTLSSLALLRRSRQTA